MRIILTDCEKYCPILEFRMLYKDVLFVKVGHSLPSIFNSVRVEDVVAVVGSRHLVADIQSNLDNYPNLRFVQLSSTGYDDISPTAFNLKHVVLSNAPGVYDETVAEYVVYMMLRYAKRYHRSLKNTMWRPFRNYHFMSELKGKTVGVMGVGNLGSRCAKILNGFDMRILGFAQSTVNKPYFDQIYHPEELNHFLEQCDFIVNALPDNAQTKGLLSFVQFSKMKESVVFINVGRETVYVRKDLVDFFTRNKNATGILDIFELIPNCAGELHRLPNIIITPRVAAYSRESDDRLRLLIRDNLSLFFKDEAPNYQILEN